MRKSARGRLLNAATHLFCKNGINATGIDAIINEAGTAKTTLYKLFGSKNNLVHVVLETEGKQWREWFIGAIEAGGGSAQEKYELENYDRLPSAIRRQRDCRWAFMPSGAWGGFRRQRGRFPQTIFPPRWTCE